MPACMREERLREKGGGKGRIASSSSSADQVTKHLSRVESSQALSQSLSERGWRIYIWKIKTKCNSTPKAENCHETRTKKKSEFGFHRNTN
jgi:hypothetical protein